MTESREKGVSFLSCHTQQDSSYCHYQLSSAFSFWFVFGFFLNCNLHGSCRPGVFESVVKRIFSSDLSWAKASLQTPLYHMYGMIMFV